ncbi:hypothetical protein ACJJTC_000317 [Scirpophaga incertulas]
MHYFLVFAAIVQCTLTQQYQQKVAPGVPPQSYQNYQQPPPPQPPQQPPQHYQQQGYQQHQYQQQVPMQQVPVQQVPVQQVPVQQAHQPHGSHGQHDPQLLNPANIAHEREHIQEHLDVPIDTSKMSEQELQFHYFKMHDADNNNKLDGCELIKSLIHWHETGAQDVGASEKTYTDDILTTVVESTLAQADLNKDGYIEYTEYKAAHLHT